MSASSDLRAQHAGLVPTLELRADALRSQITAWLVEAGVKVHSVTARVKDGESLARKLARPDRSYTALWDITDLVGLRVITYFEDDVDVVGRILEARLAIDLARSIDKRRAEPERFGYRSLHYVFEIGDGDALPAHARAEIQIRTLLAHTWAEIEHDLGYKAPGAVPASVQRRLSRVASLLEMADVEFVAIRDELAAYKDALPARIAGGGQGIALDELALGELVRSPAVAELDRAIAGAAGCELGDTVFFPDYLVKMMAVAGLPTIAELRAALDRHAATIAAIAAPYFRFAKTTWQLSPTVDGKLIRGYALFFLAHAHVLDGARLELDKVERLARLYRALDYPDDPAAAQRVASQLVAVFRSPVLAVVA